MTAAIEVDDLRKRYDGVQALDGVSLTVPEGSFFGLLGPNGAGKTTFINILVGLVRRTGGRAEVFGHDVEDDYQQARDAIGLAPQEFNVDHFFPIREVLEHKAGYHGIPASEARERAEEVLKQVGIYEKRDTRFNWLSGGMKRRFMLARALITDPDLLILDEPTAGVDVQLRHDLWDLITDLNESGTTVLLTTHYIEEAERLCDEVAILDSGTVLTVATPEDLMDRGPDRIRVTLRTDPGHIPEVPMLSGDGRYDRIEAVEMDGDQLVVTATQGGLVAPDLVRALDRAGHEIVDLDISRTSLEEVFVEMTREGGSGQQTTEPIATDGGRRSADDPESLPMSFSGLTGFKTLARREILRFLRRPRNTFVPPLITNVLYFSVFGVILGDRVGTVSIDGGDPIRYILFILPGLVVLGAISNAFENASFSIFHGRWNDYIEETLTSPMSYWRMVVAFIVAGSTRGLLVGALIAVIGTFFTTVGVARPFYLLAFALVVTLLFSSFGVVGGLWADDWDNLTMLNQFIVRPLVFFGGVFYAVRELPSPYFELSLLNPMVYMVNGVRFGFLGVSEVDPNWSLAVLSGLTVAVFALDVALFRLGYGLTE